MITRVFQNLVDKFKLFEKKNTLALLMLSVVTFGMGVLIAPQKALALTCDEASVLAAQTKTSQTCIDENGEERVMLPPFEVTADPLTSITVPDPDTSKIQLRDQNIDSSSQQVKSNEGPSIGVGSAIWNAVAEGAAALFVYVLVPIVAAIFHLIGLLFGWAVSLSISSGYIVSSSQTINLGWSIIRDFCNMLFIFILIYISISIIINRNSHNVRQMLTKVIIAALFINFSLYFAKVIVDVGNIFGNWMYNNTKMVLSNGDDKNKMDIALLMIGNMRVYDITQSYSGYYMTQQEAAESLLNPTTTVIESVGKIIFMLVATFVFAYATVLFLARIVSLILLMIFSPIMFFKGIPKIEDYTKQWWDTLWSAVTFPILFLLLIFLTSSFLANSNLPNLVAEGSSLKNLSNFFGININSILKFVVLTGLLIASLKVAKDASNSVGGVFGSLAGTFAGFVTGSIVGATGRVIGVGTKGASVVGQQTVGRLGASVRDSQWVKDKIASNSIVGRFVGRTARTVGKKASESNFDASGFVNKQLGGIKIPGGGGKIQVPKGMQASTKKGDTGYLGFKKRQSNKYREIAEELGATKENKELVENRNAKISEEAQKSVEKHIEENEVAMKPLIEKQRRAEEALEAQQKKVKDLEDGLEKSTAPDMTEMLTDQLNAEREILEGKRGALEEVKKTVDETKSAFLENYKDLEKQIIDRLMAAEREKDKNYAKAAHSMGLVENYKKILSDSHYLITGLTDSEREKIVIEITKDMNEGGKKKRQGKEAASKFMENVVESGFETPGKDNKPESTPENKESEK